MSAEDIAPLPRLAEALPSRWSPAGRRIAHHDAAVIRGEPGGIATLAASDLQVEQPRQPRSPVRQGSRQEMIEQGVVGECLNKKVDCDATITVCRLPYAVLRVDLHDSIFPLLRSHWPSGRPSSLEGGRGHPESLVPVIARGRRRELDILKSQDGDAAERCSPAGSRRIGGMPPFE